AFLTLRNSRDYSLEYESYVGAYGAWDLHLTPEDSDEGVSFRSFNWGMNAFSADEDGYPLVEPQRVRAFHSIIVDTRPGNDGFLSSSNVEYVDIGSTEPPALLPMLRIKDGSMQEGNKGTTRLDLIVTLSQSPTRTVTVNYATANGTAQA